MLCVFLQAFNGTRTGADCSQNSCGCAFSARVGRRVHWSTLVRACTAQQRLAWSILEWPTQGHTESSPLNEPAADRSLLNAGIPRQREVTMRRRLSNVTCSTRSMRILSTITPLFSMTLAILPEWNKKCPNNRLPKVTASSRREN